MTAQDEFNRIKKVIENPKNKLEHLEGIKKMVYTFSEKFKGNKLVESLENKLEILVKKIEG